MTATAESRSVPSRLAGVVEALELEQPRVVTIADLEELSNSTGLSAPGAALGYELRRLGWLLPLRTRGVWEFAPAARAGRYSAGDRHIELRAARAIDARFPGVLAMESAAVLLGLAGHLPQQEVLAVPPGYRVSKALRDWRVISLSLPGDPVIEIEGLAVWRIEALLTGMAARPDGYGDWGNVAQWLPRAAAQASADEVKSFLDGASRATWCRAGYLLAIGGHPDVGIALIEQAPAGRGPVYLGPRDRVGRFDARFDVIDSILAAGQQALQP